MYIVKFVIFNLTHEMDLFQMVYLNNEVCHILHNFWFVAKIFLQLTQKMKISALDIFIFG
jgi:hypothetical protein